MKPLKDPKHYVGYFLVTVAIFIVAYLIMQFNIASPFRYFLLFAVVFGTIALIDGGLNHNIKLQ